MYEIPTYIELEGRKFQIRNNGDYRVILDCFQALGDAELDAKERLLVCLFIFYEDMNSLEDVTNIPDLEKAVTEMYRFFNCGSDQQNSTSPHKLIDWQQDEQLISAAINTVSHTEIRSVPYIHWWTFMGYYTSIGECLLSTIVRIRDKMLKGKKLEKYERDFRRENPQYFVWNSRTVEDKEADKLIREVWNNGG